MYMESDTSSETESNNDSDSESISLSDTNAFDNSEISNIFDIRVFYPNFNKLNIVRNVNSSKKKDDNGNKECGICFNNILDGEKVCNLTVCQHIFHEECLSKWYYQCTKDKKSFTCPMCRKIQPINLTNDLHNKLLFSSDENTDSDNDEDILESSEENINDISYRHFDNYINYYEDN